MARLKNASRREEWYAKQLEAEPTPKGKVLVLQGKLFADIKRLPEERQDEAFEMAADMVQNILDEIEIRRIERWSA